MPKYKVGNDIYDIPDELVEGFLKDYPDAVVVEQTIVEEETVEPINQDENKGIQPGSTLLEPQEVVQISKSVGDDKEASDQIEENKKIIDNVADEFDFEIQEEKDPYGYDLTTWEKLENVGKNFTKSWESAIPSSQGWYHLLQRSLAQYQPFIEANKLSDYLVQGPAKKYIKDKEGKHTLEMQLPYGEGYNSWSKKQGDVIYIDPVNGEEIDININPDRWKELDKAQRGHNDGFLNGIEGSQTGRIKAIYSNTREQVGKASYDYLIKNFGGYKEIEESRLPTGTGIVKGLGSVAPNMLPSYAASNPGDALVGVVETVGDMFLTVGPALASRGLTLIPQIGGPMVADYQIQKAEHLFPDSDNPLEDLIFTEQTDLIAPTALTAVSIGMERFGIKGMSKYVMQKSFLSRGAATLLTTTQREGLTEWGQLGAETINLELAQGKSMLESGEAAWDKMVSDDGLESYIRGVVGAGVLAGGGRQINRALRNGTDGTRFVNRKIQELSALGLQKSQASPKNKPIIEGEIQRVTSELKDYIKSNDDIVGYLDSSQKNRLIELMDKKDNLYKQSISLRDQLSAGEITKQQLGGYQRAINNQSNAIDKELDDIRKEAVEGQLATETEQVDVIAKDLGFDATTTFETNKEFVEKFGKEKDGVDAFIDKAGQIYINKEAAKETGAFSAPQHELLHRILNNQFSDKTQVDKLVNDFKDSLSKDELTLLEKRVTENYDSKYLKENPDEYFTVYSSMIKEGDIKGDEGILTKIKDKVILPVLRKFGWAKADFKTGKGIRDFIKEYTRNIEGATKNITVQTKGARTIKGDKLSKSASIKVQDIYNEKGLQGAFEIIEEYKPMAAKLASNFNTVPGYTINKDILIDEILTGPRGVYDLISAYRPEQGVPLAAYINKYLKARTIEAANRVLDTEFTSDVTEARAVTSPQTAEDTIVEEEIIKTKEKTKPKSFRKLLEIDTELVDKVKGAVKKAFGTKLPSATNKQFKDDLSKIYKTELKTPVANLMGTRQEYKNFLKKNWKTIVDKLPVTTLVKFERMKSPNDRVFTKVVKTNISPTEVDQAIKDRKLAWNVNRTSGPTLYNKKAVTQKDFLNHFLGDDVAPSTKGTRKDALAEAIAEELGFDATPEVSQTTEVAEKRKAIRQLEKDVVDTTEETALIGKQINRDMEEKFSISQKIIDQEFNPDKRIDKLLEVTIGKPTYKLDSKENIDEYITAVKNILIPLFPKGFINKTVLRPSNRILPLKGKKEIIVDGKKTTVDNYYTQQRDNLLIDPDLTYGKDFTGKGKEWKARPYDNMFGENESKVNKAFKDGTVKKYNEINTSMHRQMWERIDKSIRGNKENARVIGNFLKMTGNLSDHAHRQGAELVARSINPKGFKGRTYEWEHAVPATAAYLYLLNISLENGNFKNEYAAVMDNYKLIALDKFDNGKLNTAKLSEKMPKGWKLLNNYWWQRYFNNDVAQDGGGIDTRSLVFIDGKTAFDKFKVGADGQLTTLKNLESQDKAANKNSKVFPDKLSKTTSSIGQLQTLSNYDEAAKLGRALKTPEKGISVFDFDDTLAKTQSKVLYTLPNGKKGKLSATEFAVKSKSLEDAGAVFDFSEFNKVIKGKKGPLADLALKRQGKFGSKDIFVLTARPQQAATAIHRFLKGIGLEIPLDNITGLEDGTPQAKANWVADKAAKGYNNFYFADDAIKNVKAVKQILDQIDVKSKVQQAKFSKTKKLNKEFNIILEKKTGLAREAQYSPARAKTVGASKGRFNFWIPYSAEDFTGLIYPLLGKGKEGDAQMAWFKTNLLDPFNRAEATITQDRISTANDFKQLKRNYKTIPKTLKKEAVDGFTYEQALRVYIWNKQGEEIPGLAKRDINQLKKFITDNKELNSFANELIRIQKGKPYPAPEETWLAGNLTTDLIGGINKINRKEYLQEWQENVDIIFSKENMNKLEAAYGTKYVEALRNNLTRMQKGSNKLDTGNRVVNNVLDWVNNSVGAIMFLNTRSAVLQTISAINYMNWTDNNPLKAGIAFANQKQFWSDFMKLINSDYLVTRRKGLQINVTESEIADAATGPQGVNGVISYLLKKGFVLTQFADSFAIASGGASFYRNRINTYKKQGLSTKESEKQAYLDWYNISEESQQSSRTDRISMEQASAAGRVILAFANTPMQYARLQKKAFLDLKDRRGDWKTNMSKIAYYGVVQNFIFNAIQQALFTMLFNDEEEIDESRAIRLGNGMMDSILRGIGIGGAAVSTVKNILVKLYEEDQKGNPKYENATWEMLDFSPPISSKVTKVRSALRTVDWNAKEIQEKGFSLDNPGYMAGGQIISATTNVPLDRLIRKTNNIADAVGEDTEVWQKLALLSGWSLWELEQGAKTSTDRKKKKYKSSRKTRTILDN